MRRIKAYVGSWADGRSAAEIAALAVGALIIAVVPGALTIWLAWRFLRPLANLHPRFANQWSRGFLGRTALARLAAGWPRDGSGTSPTASR